MYTVYEEVSKKKVVSVHFGSFFEVWLHSVGFRTSASDRGGRFGMTLERFEIWQRNVLSDLRI